MTAIVGYWAFSGINRLVNAQHIVLSTLVYCQMSLFGGQSRLLDVL